MSRRSTAAREKEREDRADAKDSQSKAQFQFTDLDPAFQAAEKDDRERYGRA